MLSIIPCKICGCDSSQLFSTTIRKKYLVNFYCCSFCGFVQTEKPYWLPEVYSDPLSSLDTGVVSRNISLSKTLLVLLKILTPADSIYLDYAGGYGILTRLMRDQGLKFEWFDPYAGNLFARGFESPANPFVSANRYSAVTSIECLEHTEDPLPLILDIMRITPIFIFSTELVTIPPPGPSWWYYMTERGGHISFFSRKTLQYIADHNNLHYQQISSLHILTRLPLNPMKQILVRIVLKLRLQSLFSLFSGSLTLSDHQYLSRQNRG